MTTGIHIDYAKTNKTRLAAAFEKVGATNIQWIEHPDLPDGTANADIETIEQMADLERAGFKTNLFRCNVEFGI